MSAFENIKKSEWLDKVTKDLKGKPLESLNWNVSEDLIISPFAHAEDRNEKHLPIGIKSNNNWRIGQEFYVNSSNVDEQNSLILEALNNGVESPKIIIDKVLSVDEISRLFKDVNVSFVAVYFAGLKTFEDWTALLKNYALTANSLNIASDKFFGGFHMDMDWVNFSQEDFEEMAEFEELYSSIFPRYRCFYVDGTKFYNGNENIIEELANFTHVVASCYQGMHDLGYNALQISKKFQVGFSIGKSYLLEIAKIRAQKVLFANIAEALNPGHKEIPCFDCYVSASSYEAEETESNKIRGTISSMAAVIGAVGRLTVPPSDIHADQKSAIEFNKRMATNIQQVIKLETKLHATSDPAAGSYYIEQLTEELAKKAWSRFLELMDAQ
jgi:methylmalonyl-CoA mutase